MASYDRRTKPGVIDSAIQSEAALGSDLVVTRVRLPRGTGTPVRIAENEQFVLVLRGCCRLRLANTDVALGTRQMRVIPPGVEYALEALEETEAIEIRTQMPKDGRSLQQHQRHDDPDQYLWGV